MSIHIRVDDIEQALIDTGSFERATDGSLRMKFDAIRVSMKAGVTEVQYIHDRKVVFTSRGDICGDGTVLLTGMDGRIGARFL